MPMPIKEYGVWNIGIKDWEETGMDYNNAMGLALFCCDNDEIGPRNFAVLPCVMNDAGDYEPVWHEAAWIGGFLGYDWLYDHCVAMEIISGKEYTDAGIV